MQYNYLGCFLANPDGDYGLTPVVAQQILTTSVNDCATLCGTWPGGPTLYFTLGTNDASQAVCTCGSELVAFQYSHLGLNFRCSTPCQLSSGLGVYCGGRYDGYPLVSVFGA
ncbi:hypothetical protein B0I35DRAFT_434251, partial [Stachybotrys elegans]